MDRQFRLPWNKMNRDVIGMSNRSWLKQEIPHWVKEEVITEDAGKKILSRYKGRTVRLTGRRCLFWLRYALSEGFSSSVPVFGAGWTRISGSCWLWRRWRCLFC